MSDSDLEKLEALRQEGILSEEAYCDARSRLYSPPPTSDSPPDPAAPFATEASPTYVPQLPLLPPTPPVGFPTVEGGSHRRSKDGKSRSRRRLDFVGAVVTVLGGLGAGAYALLANRTPMDQVSGSFALTDNATATANCVGQGADDSISPQTVVTLVDDAGKTLETTHLAPGTAASDVCTYRFVFPKKVKGNLKTYTVRVGSEASSSLTSEALKASGWQFQLHAGPPTTAITGTLDLNDIDTALNGCVGTGGYDDISEGANVVVKDQSGRILASSSLNAGTANGANCAYTFTLGGVRADQDQYTLTITHRGDITESATQLRDAGWAFSVSLGQ